MSELPIIDAEFVVVDAAPTFEPCPNCGRLPYVGLVGFRSIWRFEIMCEPEPIRGGHEPSWYCGSALSLIDEEASKGLSRHLWRYGADRFMEDHRYDFRRFVTRSGIEAWNAKVARKRGQRSIAEIKSLPRPA